MLQGAGRETRSFRSEGGSQRSPEHNQRSLATERPSRPLVHPLVTKRQLALVNIRNETLEGSITLGMNKDVFELQVSMYVVKVLLKSMQVLKDLSQQWEEHIRMLL